MARRTTRVLIGISLLLLSVSCRNDTEPTPDGDAGGLGQMDVGVDPTDSGMDADLGTNTLDCTPNIHGETEPDEALRGAPFNLGRYTYEFAKESGMVTVEMFDADDSLQGEFEFLPTTSTQVRAFPDDVFAAGLISGTYTDSDGGSIEVRFFNRAEFYLVSPRVDSEGVAEVEWERRFIGMTIGGKTLWLSGTAPIPAGFQADVEARYLIAVDEATAAPQNADIALRQLERDGAWELDEYYALDLDDTTTPDDVDAFLSEAGFDAFIDNAAVGRLMVLLADPAWLRASLVHVGSCIDGVDVSAAWPSALNAAGCLTALGGALGTAATFLGGVVAGFTCAVDPEPFTKVASCAGALLARPIVYTGAASTAAAAAACYCSNPQQEIIGCGYGCEISACTAACEAMAFPMCASPVRITGRCADSDLGQIESFGFSARHCECVATPSEDEMGCTTGDPHITTFDGLLYSPQIAGEYVLARSVQADFELQARMEPAATTVCPAFSYTTAVAFRWGGHELGIYYEDEGVTFYVDGAVAETSTVMGVDFDDDSNIEPAGDQWGNEGWALTTPDGIRLVVLHAHAHLQLMLVLPDQLASDTEGLLGRIDGNPDNDLQTPDGTVFAPPLSYVALADLVASPWQVSEAESLFEYVDGESTASYIVADFPDALLNEATLPEARADAARTTCQDAGVSNVHALAACIIDVACTDDETLVGGHVGNESATLSLEITDATLFTDWTPQGATATWELTRAGASAAQTSNSNAPLFFVSPTDIEPGTHVGGYIRSDDGDNDVIGFVFGFNAPLAEDGDGPYTFDTFALGWKAAAQNSSTWGAAEEGVFLTHVHGTAADEDEASSWFWAPTDPGVDTASVEVIATSFGAGVGYERSRWIRFDLYYSATGIRIDLDGNQLFDVPASAFTSPIVGGRFGFLTLSQPAQFTGFFSQPLP